MNASTESIRFPNVDDLNRGCQVISYTISIAFGIAATAISFSVASGWAALGLWICLGLLAALLAVATTLVVVTSMSTENVEAIGAAAGKAWGKVTGLFNRN